MLYRRVTVGRVTGYSLDESGDRVTIDIFVNSPYDRFVGTNSRFWEASGVEAKLDSSGVSVRTQSLLTVVIIAGNLAWPRPWGVTVCAAMAVAYWIWVICRGRWGHAARRGPVSLLRRRH